jgi:hypothetical protein
MTFGNLQKKFRQLKQILWLEWLAAMFFLLLAVSGSCLVVLLICFFYRQSWSYQSFRRLALEGRATLAV